MNLHSVDLWPNSGTLGHFQTWHPPLSFLKHIKKHFEHGCQNVLKNANRIFFSGSGWPTIMPDWHLNHISQYFKDLNNDHFINKKVYAFNSDDYL